VSDARSAILGAVRAALAGVPGDEAERWDGPGPAGSPDAYREGPPDAAAAPVDLFEERVADYRAEVVRCASVAESVAAVCARQGARRLAIPADVPDEWLPGALAWERDAPGHPLATAALDAVDGVLTGAAVAIAATGTIALDHGPRQGRRALTLVPDLHLCVVEPDQVAGSVPEAIAALAGTTTPLTFVSGPSATSDIELSRVEGVHGPRRLEIVIAG
jgi:L-lactate dehydrogenase complex protein LldG